MKKKNNVNLKKIWPFLLASFISNIMCIFVTYRWVEHISHELYSAPGYVNLIYSIPFLFVIIILLIIGFKKLGR